MTKLASRTIDPLDLAVIRGRLQQIADEMDLVHKKAAFSPVISEMQDRANSIIDPKLCEVVAQGKTGLPVFVSTMQASARAIIETMGQDLADGDVIIMNDPYMGGTHLQDVKLMRPFFVKGELVLVLLNTGHYVDVGSAAAGGFDPGAQDIFQEGLQIPPTFLVRRHALREDVMRLVLQNTRLPEQQGGDVRAQINALDIGVKRLDTLVEERGVDRLLLAIGELARRSEDQMRGYLRRIPDGIYRARDVVEISETDQLVINLALTVKDGKVEADFAGSSPPYRGPLNLARPTTETALLLAFKHLFPEVPINGGCFRAFTFKIPEDSFLSVKRPYAVGGFPESSQRVVDTVFMALADALPDAVCGIDFGSGGTVTFAGYQNDKFFSGVFPMCGGYGGSKGSDGLVHGPTPIGLANFPKLEASEHDFPIRWDALEIRPDSAGAGRWRGGPGTIFRIKALVPMDCSFLSDRARHPPLGVAGGGPAAMTEFSVHTKQGTYGGAGTSMVKAMPIQPGDWVEMRSPGGGGYGKPSERDPEAVAADLADGIVSRPAAVE